MSSLNRRVHSAPTKRLLQELHQQTLSPNASLERLAPVSDEAILHWEAVMRGVEGTAYEGGRWLLDIKIPDNYPNAPPAVRFVTRICHPNVAFEVRCPSSCCGIPDLVPGTGPGAGNGSLGVS